MRKQYFVIFALLCGGLAACDDTTQQPQADSVIVRDASGPPLDTAQLDSLRSDTGLPQTDGPTVAPTFLGIYTVTGNDPTWGSYTGQAEVRALPDGQYTVLHTQLYDTADFEGDKVALAWEGTALKNDEPYRISFELARVGFIKSYQTHTREGMDPAPINYQGSFTSTSPGVLSGTFAPQGSVGDNFTETWTWLGPNGADPIWQNQRVAIEAHAPLTADQHNFINTTFASYHTREDVVPYVNRPEFQEGMHTYIFDPTDFDFYRAAANKNTLRVIQRVVDPISLAETRVRNRAFRQTLADKAAFYEANAIAHHLVGPDYQGDPAKPSGVVSFFNPTKPAGSQHSPDGDGLEWTGDYVTSQSLRYLTTGEPVALENMLRGLRGIFICYDIAPTPGDFARTLRKHIAGGAPTWIQGLPPYQDYDWMTGANNDMIKGFENGFTAAYFVLDQIGGYEAEITRMVQIVDELLDHSDIAADWKNNEAYLQLFLAMADHDIGAKLKYELIFTYLKIWMIDWGNGSTFEMGMSDWSGNYMNVKALTHFLAMEEYMQARGDSVSHIAEYKGALKTALERMRNTRLGLYQLFSGTLGDFSSPPPEIEDAIWVLREFPAPKAFHQIDWTLNPDFCLSPVPNLPWKFDWTEGGQWHRSFSLSTYSLIERIPSNIQWKQKPGEFTGGVTTMEYSGVDYLHAYWFGRYHGVISATD